MPDQAAIVDQFWKSLKSDMTFMIGLVGVEDTHARPMTAHLDGDDRQAVWIFTSNQTELVRALGQSHRASGFFVSKGHDLFATLHGTLHADNDPAMIDRLWNPYVAAWYEGGKGDPTLQLLRFEPSHAEIWLNESSLLAGMKLLLGADPKADYRDKIAKVSL